MPELTKEQLLGEFINSLINNTTKEFLLKQANIDLPAGANLTPTQIVQIAKLVCALIAIINDSVCPIVNGM